MYLSGCHAQVSCAVPSFAGAVGWLQDAADAKPRVVCMNRLRVFGERPDCAWQGSLGDVGEGDGSEDAEQG